jgi:hypothetical protein
MTELQLVGIGTWSPRHGNWEEFCAGIQSDDWPEEVKLQPDLIPPRERRRAPQLVKMAIEVMDQACKMAAIEPNESAVIFSSAMGDMQITDYICAALAQTPKLISPTKFHNSVHNAAPGYWSIATGAFCPASAVSAFEYTPTMAFLEACIQAAEEQTPVLCVAQEVAAPPVLMDICPSEAPFSAAFLLAPAGFCDSPLASIEFVVEQDSAEWPEIDGRLGEFASNMSARFLPLMTALAGNMATHIRLPMTENMSLGVRLDPCTT